MRSARWWGRRVVLALGVCLLLGYGAVCATLFVKQRSLIYFPHAHSPLGQSGTQMLQVDGTPVYFANREHAGPKAVVYFAGNGDDAALALPLLAQTFPGHALYLLHYRSYGGTPGQPTEAALTADAVALFDKAYAQHRDVVVVGRSLGTGLAVQVASQRPVARLVLITPYAGLTDMAAQRYPFVPVNVLMQDTYQSKNYAPQISAPALLVAAQNDAVIPLSSTQALFAAFRPGVAQLKIIANVDHGSIVTSAMLASLLVQK
jgi:uncharacterized protein